MNENKNITETIAKKLRKRKFKTEYLPVAQAFWAPVAMCPKCWQFLNIYII